ncbi:MAG: HD domain-containing phosphohydrolase [Thermodesulfobacteriota bacterium]
MSPSNQEQFQILIVDDDQPVRSIVLQTLLNAGYSCREAANGKEALDILAEQRADVLITDIQMPVMDGIALTRSVKQLYDCDVIMMTGFVEDFTYEKVIEKGASDFLQKPMDRKELIVRLKRVLRERENLKERKRIEAELQISLGRLQKVLDGVVLAIALTVETRDPYTAGHQRRVANLARAIAVKMEIPENQVEGIHIAGVIHDLGKISVPAEILSKPGRLSEIEFNMIKTHSQVGYDILRNIDFPWPIAQAVYQHHERLDGSGYPRGLQSKDILMEARILSVADVVEAMASHRPYRAALGIDAALAEITKNKGRLFDPLVVNACLSIFKENGFAFEQ